MNNFAIFAPSLLHQLGKGIEQESKIGSEAEQGSAVTEFMATSDHGVEASEEQFRELLKSTTDANKSMIMNFRDDVKRYIINELRDYSYGIRPITK